MEKKKNKLIPLTVLRQSRDLSQRGLAKEINVSGSAIAQYETGKRKPTFEIGMRIASFFGVSPDKIQFDCRDVAR